jgi:hypothetical protein
VSGGRELAEAARWAIGGVLAVSGTAKLVGSRRGAAGPGVGGILVLPLSMVELATAGALLIVDAVWPVWLALAMLAVFTGVVFASLLRGTTAPCNCFGALNTKPVSSWALVRNAWFVALAVVATGAPAGAGPLPAAAAFLFVVSVVLIVVT